MMASPWRDPDNPWMAVLSGMVHGRGMSSERALLVIVILLNVGLAGAWAAAIALGDGAMIDQAATYSYIACVMSAFLAPGMGAASRAALDKHVLIAESLATPLPMESYREALRARSRMLSVMAASFAFTTAASIVATLLLRPELFRKIASGFDLMAFFMRVLRLQAYADPGGGTWAMVAAPALVASFAAGFYLNTTVLACLCQLRPMVRLEGAIMTALLLLAMPLTLALWAVILYRLPTIVIDVGAGRFNVLNPMVVIVIVVVVHAAARVAIAEWLWARRFPSSFEETRRTVLNDHAA